MQGNQGNRFTRREGEGGGEVNYEKLVKELTRIKKELEDIRMSTEVDDTTVCLLYAYLRNAKINLTSILDYIEHKIKQQKGGVQ